VGGLHARHHPETRKARDVGRRKDLGHARPAVSVAGHPGQHPFEHIEREGVGAVSDGVHPHLKAMVGGLPGDALHFLRRHEYEPLVAGSSQYGA